MPAAIIRSPVQIREAGLLPSVRRAGEITFNSPVGAVKFHLSSTSSRDRMRIAVLGAGAIGSAHARIYAARLRKKIELAAVFSRDSGRARALGKQLGVRPTSDLEDIVSDDSIDAVDVCLPSAHHRKFVVRALDHGRHRFNETPMVLDLADADAMIAAARRSALHSSDASRIVPIRSRRVGSRSESPCESRSPRDRASGHSPRSIVSAAIRRSPRGWNTIRRQCIRRRGPAMDAPPIPSAPAIFINEGPMPETWPVFPTSYETSRRQIRRSETSPCGCFADQPLRPSSSKPNKIRRSRSTPMAHNGGSSSRAS